MPPKVGKPKRKKLREAFKPCSGVSGISMASSRKRRSFHNANKLYANFSIENSREEEEFEQVLNAADQLGANPTQEEEKMLTPSKKISSNTTSFIGSKVNIE